MGAARRNFSQSKFETMKSELAKLKQALDLDEVKELHRLRAENARLLEALILASTELASANKSSDVELGFIIAKCDNAITAAMQKETA